MTITSGPFEDQDTTEAQYAELMQELGDGVRGTVGDTSLEVTGDASGLNVKVAAGFAIVRGTFFKSTSEETLTVATADAQPRIDTVVLRRDETENEVSLEIKKGTAGVSPVPPTLVTTNNGYEFPLANIAVAGSAVTINPGDVTDGRKWLAPAIWTGTGWTFNASDIDSGTLDDARLPNHSAALLTSGTLPDARLDDTDWATLSGSGLQYRRRAGVVYLRGFASISGTNTLQTAMAGWDNLPSGFRPAQNVRFPSATLHVVSPEPPVDAVVAGVVEVRSNGSLRFQHAHDGNATMRVDAIAFPVG